MRRETKATSIPRAVKDAVFRRDNMCCIVCGSIYGLPNAHFIARSHGGLGVEENILTLCPECHREYDQSPNRRFYREKFRAYLKSKYPNWDESKLIYKKYGG